MLRCHYHREQIQYCFVAQPFVSQLLMPVARTQNNYKTPIGVCVQAANALRSSTWREMIVFRNSGCPVININGNVYFIIAVYMRHKYVTITSRPSFAVCLHSAPAGCPGARAQAIREPRTETRNHFILLLQIAIILLCNLRIH